MGRSPLRLALLLIPLVFACFALSPTAQAVSPAPDGGYPGGNTAEGQNALFSLTTGTYNTAIGLFSLRNNTTGSFNTAVGAGTLLTNTGDENTATGAGALLSNTTGTNNTATGESALFFNTTGGENTANGANALSNNATGNNNTATGFQALFHNNIGNSNTANGHDALLDNVSGVNNTAVGAAALRNNSTGTNNTANGESSLANSTTGSFNAAAGVRALVRNTTGSTNAAVGYHALQDNTTGTSNIALGANAGVNLTTGDNNINIGYNVSGPAGESATIRIGDPFVQGATYVAGISGAAVPGGASVIVDTSGHLGTIMSSQRFKDDIKPMDEVSEAILALNPVTFRYKKELDPQGIPQFGLVAEEVARVSNDLVARDAKGEVYTVRYDAVNAMLLNEFLKEHKKVEEQQATITQLKKDFGATIAQLTTRLDEQAAQIQKVSAQLEASKPASQVVNNP